MANPPSVPPYPQTPNRPPALATMQSQQKVTQPAPNLSASVDAGFSRTVKRYLSAWPSSTSAIQPTLTPADTFFVPSGPSQATNCPLCVATFPTNDLLRSHIFTSHPNAYGPAPVLSPLHPSFPTPPPVLPALSNMPAPPFAPPGTAFPPEAWLPMSSGSLGAAPSPQLAALLARSAATKPVVKNPDLYCDVCEVPCDTATQLESHKGGQKHHKKSEIHRAFVEASKRFEGEGITQLALNIWNCVHCSTSLQGKTPVMQHLEAVKHKKHRDAAAGNAWSSGNATKGRKRARPTTPVLTPPRSASGGRGADAAKNGMKNERVAAAANTAADTADGQPSMQKPEVNPGVIGDKHPRGNLLSVLQAAAPKSGACGMPSQSLLRSLPSPLLGSSFVNNSTPPTMDSLRSPASTMSLASPSELISPNQSVPNTNSGLSSPPKTTVNIPALKNTKPNHGVQLPSAKAVKEFSCVTCNISCNSMDSLIAHLASPKHRRKQALLEGAQSAPGPAAIQQQVPAENSLHCDVCNIVCCGTENFEAHRRGKLHAKRVRLKASQAKGE